MMSIMRLNGDLEVKLLLFYVSGCQSLLYKSEGERQQ